MSGFCDKLRSFKEKLELWFVKVKNKKLISYPILNRSIEDLDPESNLMALISFAILEHLHTLRKNLKHTFQKTLTTISIKIHSSQKWPILVRNFLVLFKNS